MTVDVVAADFLVGLLDAIDVGVRDLLVEGDVRLGLHLDSELIALKLVVALERHAVDDLRALDDRDDTWSPTTLADTRVNMPVAVRSATARLTLAWSVPVK